MIYYKDFINEYYKPKNHGHKDNTIFTFDIESTSYLILDGKQYNTLDYLNFTDKEQQRCEFRSCMYIWQFSIEDKVFYGRTWLEFLEFLNTINSINPKAKKYIFVHNLSFEFQFLKSVLYFTDVMARTSHKVMKASFMNFEWRCSYYMSNCALKQLPKVFNLPVEKMVGDLDYSLIRTSKTPLTEKELGYCEHDCLVVYYYIKMELEEYKDIWRIPITSTGHVRKELKDRVNRNFIYRRKVRRSVNVDPHVYNLLQDAFAGGYTHSNYIYTDMVLKNITSWDFTSSYPYCLLAFKYPATKFTKCNIKDINDLDSNFAYLVHIEMYDIDSKFFNHFLSQSKCYRIKNGRYDNGRIISADLIEITVTDVDLKIITSSYNYSGYKIIECYYSKYDYLPKEFLEFILEKYKNKTKYKNVKGMEVEYSKEKGKFNSLYGMSVTNTIRDEVIFDPETTNWEEIPLTNEEIQDKLYEDEKKGFLSFSYGCWCTAYGRYNLITNIQKLDRWVVYGDTDSIKLKEGYDKKVIDDYNKEVEKRIEHVSKVLGFDIEMYKPKDQEGLEHMLGVFDFDGFYDEFITQGAKKYAVIKTIKNKKVNETYQKVLEKGDETSKVMEITVAGVPKSGVYQLNSLDDFKDDLVFEFKNTNKNMLVYVEDQEPFELTDYLGNKEKVIDVSGCCLVPITYTLGKSIEYEHLLSDDSSKRARYNE